MKPQVDIIVCMKNNKDIISKCLNAIKNQTYKNIKCFILDDGSKDGSCKFVKRKFPKMKCIQLGGMGPSHNRNVGIREGSGKYIVTLDSDSILTQKWVSKAVEFMEKNPKTAIVSGKILYEDRKNIINIAGGGMGRSGVAYHRGEGKNKRDYNEIKKTIYLCSAAMIIRRNVLKTIGGFDSTYFYGYEDLDLCWRANLAGFEVVYFPFAESYHEENSTIKKMPSARARFLGSKNRMFTLFKNYELSSLIKYSPLFVAHFIFLVTMRNKRASTIKAYLWNLKNIKKIIAKRKEIKTMRKKRDKELLKLF